MDVQQAAEVFDKIRPGWHKEINTEKLNMRSVSDCVLGQLSHVHDAVREWGHIGHHFDHDTSLFCGGDKGQVWIEQIEKRLAEDGAMI